MPSSLCPSRASALPRAAGGLQRLPRTIPLKKAMGMLLTGRHVPAQEGYEMGFVTAVVPHADLMQEARRWANMILECSPMSVRATKQTVRRSLDVPSLEIAMRNLNYPAYVALTTSEDTIEHDQRAVRHGAPGEVVDQQVDAKARRHAEHRGEPQRYPWPRSSTARSASTFVTP